VLQCNVTKEAGEDVTFHWRKEGSPLVLTDKMDKKVEGTVSVLTIKAAGEDEAGIYTCIAAKGKEPTGSDLSRNITAVRKLPSTLFKIRGKPSSYAFLYYSG